MRSNPERSSAEEVAGAAETDAIRGDGRAGTLGCYACRAGAFVFGSVERSLRHLHRRCSRSRRCCCGSIRGARPMRRRIAAEHIPAVERAYVFGGPTDLFLLHDQASVRLAMQNYGKTPAVIREWLVEFVAQEPRGRKPAYDASKRTVDQRDPRAVQAVLARPRCSARRSPRRSSSSAISSMRTCSGRTHTTRFCVGVARDGKAAYAGHPEWNAYD